MRSLVTSLVTFLLLAVVVLVAALFAAVGVGAIGWLVARIFDLTQWQGTLLALGVTLGVGFLVYQFGGPPAPVAAEPTWGEWNDSPRPPESPVVPWRKRRPTEGRLPDEPGSRN